MQPSRFQACGADPEVFFRTKEGEAYSVEGILGGSKHDPLPIPGLPAGFCVQEDNVAAEYNIPPANTARQFSLNVAKGLQYLKKVAAKHKLELAVVPDLDFPIHMVRTPHAMQLGCEPDFNAWTGEENPRPRPPYVMRTAAGHVHVSWNEPDKEQQLAVARILDAALGLPSVMATEPTRRRDLYGKAGAMRFKPYGMEYRVLDNFWIADKNRREHVFQTVKDSIELVNQFPVVMEQINDLGDAIQQAINEHDKGLAADLMEQLDVSEFPALARHAA
jgi:hypothetical protein